jgi:hypothetical protein
MINPKRSKLWPFIPTKVTVDRSGILSSASLAPAVPASTKTASARAQSKTLLWDGFEHNNFDGAFGILSSSSYCKPKVTPST